MLISSPIRQLIPVPKKHEATNCWQEASIMKKKGVLITSTVRQTLWREGSP